MAISQRQKTEFAQEITPLDQLTPAINWIKENLEIEDVFGAGPVIEYARAMKPEDVFSEKQLRGWAEDNGFVEVED